MVGGVIIISLKLKNQRSIDDMCNLIRKSGFVAGLGLFIIYAGLIAVGAFYGKEIFIDGTLSNDMQRATLLRGISTTTLGNIGTVFLSVLVALACFTTAVGIVTGTSDYFKGLFKNSPKAYTITAVIGCLIGIGVGQLDFHTIIMIALPILKFIYPITIVLIILNILPDRFATSIVFKSVVLITLIFSIPDFLGFVVEADWLVQLKSILPFAKFSLGWVLPALIIWVLLNLKNFTTKSSV